MNPESTTHAPEGAPAPEARWLKFVRSFVSTLLALTLTLIVGLAAMGYVPVAKQALEPMFDFGGKVSGVAVAVSVLVIVLLPLGLFMLASRRRWLTWPVLGANWVVAGVVLVWLAWDEPAIRQPLPIEEFSPVFAGAEQSYGVLMRYSKNADLPEVKNFAAQKWSAVFTAANPRDAAKWKEFVVKNREAIERDWATLEPQRRWLAELNAFERIGDLTPPRFDADIVRFDVWRTLSQRGCAIATLQAIDGHGDEALATLRPLVEAARKMQTSSRTLVRFMIAVVVQKMAVDTAAIVLDVAPVGAEARAQFAAALAGRNPAAGARRILLMEYATFSPMIGAMRLGDHYAMTHGGGGVLRRPLNFLSALLINPNATTNLYGGVVFELAALAEARELGKVAVRSKGFSAEPLERGGMKNLGGRLMLVMAVPAYDKVLESYWKLDDACTAVVKRLEGMGG